MAVVRMPDAPSVNATVPNFGEVQVYAAKPGLMEGKVIEQFNQAAEGLNKAVDDAYALGSEIRAKSAYNKIQDQVNELNSQALSRMGEDVTETGKESFYDYYSSEMKKIVDANKKNLDNYQSALVDQMSEKYLAEKRLKLMNHQIRQSLEVGKATNKALYQKSLDSLAMTTGKEERDYIRRQATSYLRGANPGVPSEVLDQAASEDFGRSTTMALRILIDNDDVEGARRLYNEEKSMLPASVMHSANRIISAMETKKKEENAAFNLEAGYTQETSDVSLLKRAYGDDSIADEDVKKAIDLANGDKEKAMRIMCFGVDAFEKEYEKDNKFDVRSATTPLDRDKEVPELSKKTTNALNRLKTVLMKSDSRDDEVIRNDLRDFCRTKGVEVDEVAIDKVAKKVLKTRLLNDRAVQEQRNYSAKTVFNAMKNGEKYNESDLMILSDSQREGIMKWKDRRNNGTLCDFGRAYELDTNPDKLRDMTWADFYAEAYQFSENTFARLENKKQQYDGTSKSKSLNVSHERCVKAANMILSEFNLDKGSTQEQKQMANYLGEIIANHLEATTNIQWNGKIPDDEVLLKYGREFVSREIAIPRQWTPWKFGEESRVSIPRSAGSIGTIYGSDKVEIPSELKGMIQAGLRDIYPDPTEQQMSRSFLYMATMNKRPIQGAETMAKYLLSTNPETYNMIKVGILKREAGRNVSMQEASKTWIDPNRIVAEYANLIIKFQ